MGDVIQLEVRDEFVVIECCDCGINFAMPESFDKRCRDNGAWFLCPRGHAQHYSKAPVPKLQQEVQTLRSENERLEKENDRLQRKLKRPKWLRALTT